MTPICAWCGRVRIERIVADASGGHVVQVWEDSIPDPKEILTHSICPQCQSRLDVEIAKRQSQTDDDPAIKPGSDAEYNAM